MHKSGTRKKAIKYHKAFTNIVQIHNNLVEAHYKFSAEQQKILLIIAKKLQQDDIFNKNIHLNTLTFNARELAEEIGVGDLRTLRGVVKSLQRCIMSFNNIEEKWEEDVNVFTRGRYHAGGEVDIEVHNSMLPFFKELEERYTKLNIKEVAQFNSQYSIRIYELCRRLQFIAPPKEKAKTYTLDEFQKMVGSNYKTWQHIEEKVLKVAEEEINKKTRVWFGYTPIKEYADGQKRGRKGVRKIKIEMNIAQNWQPSLY